jgi:phytoene/squalene synthetase
MGIYFLKKELRDPIYAIYGYVRFADEIVDTFEGYDKAYLLNKFKVDTYEAIDQRISLNPILNAFQQVVHRYKISFNLIDSFLNSMEMDLSKVEYSRDNYQKYILGSAEVVGLMCLHVFTNGDKRMFEELKPAAMKLGSAFQKVNFLRDLKADYENLGRTYFPGVDPQQFNGHSKELIEREIEAELEDALEGIKRLPASSRGGVYLAFVYYRALFNKIKRVPAHRVLSERIRISNGRKFGLMLNSMLQYKFNML